MSNQGVRRNGPVKLRLTGKEFATATQFHLNLANWLTAIAVSPCGFLSLHAGFMFKRTLECLTVR